VGVNNLFTEDFYESVRSRLTEDGVFCLWTQFYELSEETLASLLRTLAAVFPEAEVFVVNRDLLLVAPAGGRPLDLERVARRLARPEIAADLARADVRSAADLVALHRTSLASLVAALPPAPLNTDDRPVVEYRAPRDLYRVRPDASPRPAGALAGARTSGDGASALELARWTTGGQAALAEQIESDRLRTLALEDARRTLAAYDIPGARQRLDAILVRWPGFRPALIDRARIAMQDGEVARARALLTTSLAGASADETYQARCHLGMIELRTASPASALAEFERASAARPEIAGAYVFQARALAALGRVDDARAVLDRAAAVVTDRPAIDEARAALLTASPAP
jgi:Tfp pilus assembly protein PilF